MDRTSSGAVMLLVGIALCVGGGYLFMNSPVGGVNPATVGPFAALLAGIVLLVLGKSRMAAGGQEGLAGEAGLEVKSGFSLTGSERVEMEGDFGGFKVHVSRRETHSTRRAGGGGRHYEDYVFSVELANPAGLDLYVGPDSILQAPLGFLPAKLDSSLWGWAGQLAVRGAPSGASEAFFSDRAAWPLFTGFFGKVDSCRLKGGTMEFECSSSGGLFSSDGEFLTSQEVKGLILQAVEVARLADALPPAGPRAE